MERRTSVTFSESELLNALALFVSEFTGEDLFPDELEDDIEIILDKSLDTCTLELRWES